MSTPAKKPSFGDLMSNLGKFAKNPTTQNKIAALGDHTDQGRKETGISAPANESAVNELTHLSDGAETSKRESDVNPQGVPTGTRLPDQPSLKEKELEREEKPVSGAVNKEAAGETAQEILARFKSNLKLAEGGTEGDSAVAKAVLAGKPAPNEAVTTPSEGASRTLEAAKVHNGEGTSEVAKDVLDGSPVSDKTASVDLDLLAQKTAAWMQHSEFGYEAARQMFAPFGRLMKEAAAFSPAAFLQELKVAAYQPLLPDRAALETVVNERTTQLKTAGRNDAEISEFLKAAGAEDRRMIDFENAVRQDERQKVAAELELQALVITKVAHYQALGMTEPEIRSALQKDAEADAQAMMGGAGGDPTGGMPPGGDPTGGAGGAAPGGIDPAQVMQLNQAIQALAAQNGLSEEQVIQMLEQEAQGAGGAAGGGAAPGGDPAGGMPPGADPTGGAGGAPAGMPPGAAPGAGGAPAPDSGAGDEGGGDKPPKKKEDKEDGDDDGGSEEKKEAARARKISPEIENLFAAIDAQVGKGALKPQAAQKMAHALLAEIK